MKKMILFTLCFLILVITGCGNKFTSRDDIKYELYGKVIKVADGDTFTLSANKKTYKIRMYGIDAPESDQLYGRQSAKYLSTLILNKNVGIKIIDEDRYKRIVGKVYLNNEEINLKLLKDGIAWFYEYHASNEDAYKKASEEAKRLNLGLWSDKNAINPREFRVKYKKLK
ncbi:MAG: thermonuclease family protein [Fusobacteriaceae bacterium]|jgi:endonuclease YncB( thermonuclease family)|nr:thermonuclease family protein [Fusobacteriaceae bacterium]